jgi:glycosyltransferase involved in cell wall biosynthesis
MAHAASDGPVYLYVGRLSPEKRLDILLKAFRRLRETVPSASLRIVGTGPQGGELLALARDLALGDSVVFAGAKSGVALTQEYLSATCLVLPSWSEPWGLVVNEALHYGCPVVVSHRCGCVPELVEDSPSGLVFTCDDEADLADKLQDAVVRFSNICQVAKDCISQVAPNKPSQAAEQIRLGLRNLASKDSPHKLSGRDSRAHSEAN